MGTGWSSDLLTTAQFLVQKKVKGNVKRCIKGVLLIRLSVHSPVWDPKGLQSLDCQRHRLWKESHKGLTQHNFHWESVGGLQAIGIEQNLENANINNMPRVVFKNKGNDTFPWFFQRLLHKTGTHWMRQEILYDLAPDTPSNTFLDSQETSGTPKKSNLSQSGLSAHSCSEKRALLLSVHSGEGAVISTYFHPFLPYINF